MPSVDKVTADDKNHVGDVTSIAFHGGCLYSAGSDGKVKIWDEDLNLKREVIIHEAYIYAIAVDRNGRLYTSSCDGTIKSVEKPLESDSHTVVLQHENEIEAMFVDDNLILHCGDNKGGVTSFENGKFKLTINIVESVKSLYVEKDLFYTLLNMDLSIHEVRDSGKFMMKASIPGKFPVTLFGAKTEGRSKYIAILTRDGRGITIVKNALEEKFQTLTVKENLHELIVNAMAGTGSDVLFSCDYAGKIFKSKIEGNELKELDSITTGSGCANCIAVINENSIYIGSTDGTIKRISF